MGASTQVEDHHLIVIDHLLKTPLIISYPIPCRVCAPPPKVFLGVGGREKNFQGGLRVDLGPVVVVVAVVVVVVVVVVAGSGSHPVPAPASGCRRFWSHDI